MSSDEQESRIEDDNLVLETARSSLIYDFYKRPVVRNFQIALNLFFVSVRVLANAVRKFTLEELKQYDGKDGRPAYIAYKGKVYDVTDDFMWIAGDHQAEHQAGRDLTEEMSKAPHGEETLERVAVVGVLVS
jgi:predicted heme/steroid binding protein